MIHAYFTAILLKKSRFYESNIFNRKFKFKIGFIRVVARPPESNGLRVKNTKIDPRNFAKKAKSPANGRLFFQIRLRRAKSGLNPSQPIVNPF